MARRKRGINPNRRIIICQRCGHTWNPRVRRPKQCPDCQSEYYNTPRIPQPVDYSVEYSAIRVIKKYNSITYWQKEDYYDLAEEKLPKLVEKQIQTVYPADPVQKYCWGKIGGEIAWFTIIVIRSREEDSEISYISKKVKNRWERRVYNWKDKFPASRLMKNHIVLLDYRNKKELNLG